MPKVRKARKVHAAKADTDPMLARVHEFMKRATVNFLATLPENMSYMKSDLPLVLKTTKMYYRVQTIQYPYTDKTMPVAYTYAIIDRKTGNVYRPSAALNGTLNRDSAIVKGNVNAEDYGATRATYDGMEREK